MPPETVSALARAIKEQHGFEARFREVTRIRHELDGRAVWEGDVYIFDVDAAAVSHCYAWVGSWPSGTPAPVAVCRDDACATPDLAVRAWIASEAAKHAAGLKR